jgi:hypothetical protein
MPRQLSDHEFVAFDNEIDVDALNLPPWGGVVKWEGLEVLVFEGPGGLFLTDISDIRPLVEAIPNWEYSPYADIFIWHLPEETAGVIIERMQQVSEATSFTFQNLGIIVALTISAFLFFELRRPS